MMVSSQKPSRWHSVLCLFFMIFTYTIEKSSSYQTSLSPSLFSSVQRNNVYKQCKYKYPNVITQGSVYKRIEDNMSLSTLSTLSKQRCKCKDNNIGEISVRKSYEGNNRFDLLRDNNSLFGKKAQSRNQKNYRRKKNLKLFSAVAFEQEGSKTTKNML